MAYYNVCPHWVAIWIQERSVIVKALRRENRRRAGLSTVSF